MEYIDARLDGSRRLIFDSSTVYSGEHLTHTLRIDLEGSALEGADVYRLRFEIAPSAGLVCSNEIEDENSAPAYIDGSVIYCPLTRMLTYGSSLKVQVAAEFDREGDESAVLLSGTGTLYFENSLTDGENFPLGFDDDLLSRIGALDRRVSALEGGQYEFNYDYFAAAIGARLLFEDFESTPVWFPHTFTQLTDLVNTIIADYETGSGVKHLIVTPADGSTPALMTVCEKGGSVTASVYRGKDLLTLLKGA